MGICYDPICIVTEFLPGGDLGTYLANNKPSLLLKQQIMADIATGVQFEITNTIQFSHCFCLFFSKDVAFSF